MVTITKAAMWTDGRYFLQATMQMDSNWKLMKMGTTCLGLIYKYCYLAGSIFGELHYLISLKKGKKEHRSHKRYIGSNKRSSR